MFKYVKIGTQGNYFDSNIDIDNIYFFNNISDMDLDSGLNVRGLSELGYSSDDPLDPSYLVIDMEMESDVYLYYRSVIKYKLREMNINKILKYDI